MCIPITRRQYNESTYFLYGSDLTDVDVRRWIRADPAHDEKAAQVPKLLQNPASRKLPSKNEG
jgi:hypothetical protein